MLQVIRHRFAAIQPRFYFGWAISRATTMGPLNDTRVPTGIWRDPASRHATDGLDPVVHVRVIFFPQ